MGPDGRSLKVEAVDNSKKANDYNGLAEWIRNNPINVAGASAEDDEISHPAHYTRGIETYDYIRSWHMNYAEGNIIKYVSRWRFKGGVTSLKKARWYLDRLIEEAEQGDNAP